MDRFWGGRSEFFQRVIGNRTVEGDGAEWLVRAMLRWASDHPDEDYWKEYLEYTCQYIGHRIKENYVLPLPSKWIMDQLNK